MLWGLTPLNSIKFSKDDFLQSCKKISPSTVPAKTLLSNTPVVFMMMAILDSHSPWRINLWAKDGFLLQLQAYCLKASLQCATLSSRKMNMSALCKLTSLANAAHKLSSLWIAARCIHCLVKPFLDSVSDCTSWSIIPGHFKTTWSNTSWTVSVTF